MLCVLGKCVLIFHYYLLCLSHTMMTILSHHARRWLCCCRRSIHWCFYYSRVTRKKRKIEIDNKLGAHDLRNDKHTHIWPFFLLIYSLLRYIICLWFFIHTEFPMRRHTTTNKWQKAANTYTLFNLLNSMKWQFLRKMYMRVRQTGCTVHITKDWALKSWLFSHLILINYFILCKIQNQCHVVGYYIQIIQDTRDMYVFSARQKHFLFHFSLFVAAVVVASGRNQRTEWISK